MGVSDVGSHHELQGLARVLCEAAAIRDVGRGRDATDILQPQGIAADANKDG